MSLKKCYYIKGFDCPNCALKSERHLKKQEEIEDATIDFQNNRLFITYKDEELSIEEIKARIAEVEFDKIKLTPISEESSKKETIFDKEFFIRLARIIASTLIMVFTKIFVNYQDNFTLALILYSLAILICLYDIVWKVILNFIKLNNPIDMNLLLTLSSTGVVILSSLIHYQVLPEGPFEIDLLDGAMVIALYQVGELLEHVASNKSKNAIHKAVDLRADKANLLKDDKVIVVTPEELKVGDTIIVNVGDVVPVDAVVISGTGSLDTSSLTGESLPLDVKENDSILSGTIVKSGSLTLRVKNEFANSTVTKIMDLVASSGERKAKAEKFITKFARFYTPAVFVIGITYILVFGFVTGIWPEAIFGGLSILVVSCPCAIVISVPLAYFAGIGLASKHNIIVKGGNYLDSLCNIGTLFIDKTGTLTYGNFKVSEINPINISKEELLDAIYVAESRSNHPLAKAITNGVDISKYSNKIDEYNEYPGEGIFAKTGKDKIIAGTASFLSKNFVKVEDFVTAGTVIYVAKNGNYIGNIILKDEVRIDSKETIEKLSKIGVKVVLLSGDKELCVREVSNHVGIEEYHYGLLPQDKTKFVEEAVEAKNKKLVAFAGDGINDTPSIIRADVGIAMGGIGSDAAVENADVVLMQDNPRKIYDSIVIAKKTRRIAIFNIVFSLLVKVSVIVLILTGILGQFGMLIAVLADTGLTVLMIINSLLLIYRKID